MNNRQSSTGVRVVRRAEADARRLGRALIALAQSQAEAEAEATATYQATKPESPEAVETPPDGKA